MNARFKLILDRARADLLSRGVDPGYVRPPMSRLCWALGVPIRPLICMHPIALFLWIFLGSLMGMLIIAAFAKLIIPALVVGPPITIIASAVMTKKIVTERRRVNPPSWDDYTKMQDDAEKK